MAQSKEGAKKAVFTIKEKYGEDFYTVIGTKGGKKTGMKGFALNRQLAVTAGRKGGKLGKRGKSVKTVGPDASIKYIDNRI